MAQALIESPLTGILAEDKVVIDFGEFIGKSILEISDTEPEFYNYLMRQKEDGNFLIKRAHDKTFRAQVHIAPPRRIKH